MNKADWRLAGWLSAGGLLGLVGSAPFILPLFRAVLGKIPGPLPLPLPLLFAVGLVQQAVLVVLLTCIGVLFARKIGLGAPLLEGWLAGNRPGSLPWSTLRLALRATRN